ncbi:regulatory subunit of cyclin-dependent kinase [Catenaria anguillulae PL171]|uniref:Cyclin-dependent kinases regulatory subunit n=1 Tax=Catenaria anguillulae PL171 TaxID=765915 RepID=A0A1Y2H802_9FUNG|nr:regulatory subunit of cyclin-dependent kinase [Catenaria anguillulae PL171]
MSDYYEDYDPSNAQQRAAHEASKRRDAEIHRDKIVYSARYNDDTWEYRHVTIPRELVRYVPRDRLMTEMEWRDLGVQQSLGWEHYLVHKPEPHVLLFRREKDYQIKYPNGKPEDNERYNEATRQYR